MVRHLLHPGVTFLNHGSFGACPAELLDEAENWRRTLEQEPVDFFVRKLPGLLSEALEAVGGFLGAPGADLAFVPNATAGVNAVLAGLRFGPGDEVLTTDHRYGAVSTALRRWVERDGGRVVEAPVPFPLQSPAEIAAAVLAGLGPRTRLLVVDHISSPTALVFPVAEIVAGAHARGVPVLVDGAHVPGQIDVSLGALGADWWVGNLHKWLCCPRGTAVLYTHPRHQAATRALTTSHGYGGGYRAEFDWPGTFDPAPWLAAPRAIALHAAQGGPAFRAAHHALVRAGREVVADALGLPLPHPDDPALYAAMSTIPLGLPAAAAGAVHDALFHRHQIEVPVVPWGGAAWVRISGYAAHNRPEHYAALARVLPGIVAGLR